MSYEAIRLWCNKFGPQFARNLRRNHQGFGDTFFIDEVFVKIQGKQYFLWRAVDQDGEVVDVFLQKRRDGKAAKRFFNRLLKKYRGEPRKQAQRFLGAHAAVYNLFNLGRHLVSAKNYRYFRTRAFESWEKAVAL